MNYESIARYFYEKCCGTYSGHMARIPNNPDLFCLIKSHFKSDGDYRAATESEFAAFLEHMAEALNDKL